MDELSIQYVNKEQRRKKYWIAGVIFLACVVLGLIVYFIVHSENNKPQQLTK